MKTIDWGEMGGFPLTQDIMEWLQEGYVDSINKLASIFVLPGEGLTIISGCTYTMSGSVLTATNGWMLHDEHGIIPFIPTTSVSATSAKVKIVDVKTPLVFQNGVSNLVKIRKIATWDTSPVSSNPLLMSIAKNGLGYKFGAKNRSGWNTFSTDYGELEYQINRLSNKVRIRGIVKIPSDALPGAINTLTVKICSDFPDSIQTSESVIRLIEVIHPDGLYVAYKASEWVRNQSEQIIINGSKVYITITNALVRELETGTIIDGGSLASSASYRCQVDIEYSLD